MTMNSLQLNVVVLIDEWDFFHPQFLERVIHLFDSNSKKHILIVKKVPSKSNIKANFLNHILRLKVSEICKLLVSFVKSKVSRRYCKDCRNKRSYSSVSRVAQNLNLEHTIIREKGDLEKFFACMKKHEYDLLISSNSLYIKASWLEKFSFGGINRHSSLLPAYKGLWPVFHAAARGEVEFGVSVHEISPSIDEGRILEMQSFIKEHNDTIFSLYEKIFDLSPSAVKSAIECLVSEQTVKLISKEPSYYSKLTKQDWIDLRKNNISFI